MKIIADFHVHSRFSRATSKNLTIPNMYRSAKLKGLNILGTGDFTHPKWFTEIRTELVEAEDGLFRLNDRSAKEVDKLLPNSCRNLETRFWLTVEISNIYKRGGKVRRLHNVVVAPDLVTVAKINTKLAQIGNLHSDGRPILGLDSEELLKIVLDINPEVMFIPAHIWTPWFAMFGSKSGFDSLEEAFGDNAGRIAAVETGLSADPKMCRSIANLNNVALVSNSDAHSNEKFGREATIFDSELSYKNIRESLINNDSGLVGTIEFYPQEGKYYYDGHAACQVSLTPEETKRLAGKCPKCGGNITVGVLSRVQELALKNPSTRVASENKKVEYIVPLPDILAEVTEASVKSQKTQGLYAELIDRFGPEFTILNQTDISKILEAGYVRVAEAIDKMRRGDIVVEPGYDGVFGVVKIFGEDATAHQMRLV